MKRYLTFLAILFFSHCLMANSGIVIVQVSPEKINLKPGQQYNFVAHAYDEEGREVFFFPEWRSSGGSITQEGVFIAAGKSGIYEVIATDTSTGASGSASVMIDFNTNSYPKTDFTSPTRSLRLVPGNIGIKPGQKVQFIVQAFDRNGKRMSPPTNLIWKVSGGGSITPSGIFQAGGVTGSFTVEVREPGGAFASSQVYINMSPGYISRITISPSSASIRPGEQTRFFATAYDSSGQIVSFTPQWNATGGVIDSNGIYYADNIPGNYTVWAVSPEGVRASVALNINQVYISSAQIFPKSAILAPGEVQKFTVVAYGRDGNALNLFPTWSADGGIIQADGLYRAGNIPGNYRLSAQVENYNINVNIAIVQKAQTNDVNIYIPKFDTTSAEVTRINIHPSNVKLQPGQSFSFKITGYDKDNRESKIKDLKIYATGGKMDAQGIYVAGEKPGPYEVKISTPTGLSNVANIEILGSNSNNTNTVNNNMNGNVNGNSNTNNNTQIKWLTIAPQFVATEPNKETQFIVKGYDASGKEIPCTATWSCPEGNISATGLFTAGQKLGSSKVYANVGSVNAEADVVVKAPENVESVKEKVTPLKLVVIPPKVVLKAGEKCNFNASVEGKESNSLQLEWITTGGTINNNGAFVAGETPGEYIVEAYEKTLKIKQQVSVTIEKVEKVIEYQSGAIRFEKWYVMQEPSGLADIHIDGKVLLEDTAMLKLLLHRKDYEELVYQLAIKKDQRFSIQGKQYVAGGNKLEVVLYNAKGEVIHRESK